jgi:hypothetical protein
VTHPNQYVRPITDTEARHICDLYRIGATIVEASQLTGRSTTTVQKVLREHGVPRRPSGGRHPSDTPEARARRREALGAKDDEPDDFTGIWQRVGLVWKPVMAA